MNLEWLERDSLRRDTSELPPSNRPDFSQRVSVENVDNDTLEAPACTVQLTKLVVKKCYFTNLGHMLV